jgi:hypothetical protein
MTPLERAAALLRARLALAMMMRQSSDLAKANAHYHALLRRLMS